MSCHTWPKLGRKYISIGREMLMYQNALGSENIISRCSLKQISRFFLIVCTIRRRFYFVYEWRIAFRTPRALG